MCSSKRPSVEGFVSMRPGRPPVDLRAQVVEVEVPALVRLHLLELEAGHGDAGRVRAVGRVRGDDDAPLVRLAPVGEVRAHEHQPGELALRARGGLERDRVQPADLGEDLLQAPHELERALRRLLLLVRMEVAEAGQVHDPLVHARVVLHRAGAERVEARVDAEVAVGERGEVADEVGLRDLGQARRRLRRSSSGHLRLRQVVARQRARATARLRLLVDQLHRATSPSTSASRSMSSGVRFSVTATSSASSRPG